jgi:hypothetical protein
MLVPTFTFHSRTFYFDDAFRVFIGKNLQTHQSSGLLSISQKGTNKHQGEGRKIMKICCVK